VLAGAEKLLTVISVGYRFSSTVNRHRPSVAFGQPERVLVHIGTVTDRPYKT